MRTHTASIYHCMSCGRVVQADLDAEPPQCCGHTMATAVAKTIRKGDVAGEMAGRQPETAPPVIKGRKKPR